MLAVYVGVRFKQANCKILNVRNGSVNWPLFWNSLIVNNTVYSSVISWNLETFLV